MQPLLMRMMPSGLSKAVSSKDGKSAGVSVLDYMGTEKLKAAKSLEVDLDIEARLDGYLWAGVHATLKREHLCPKGKKADKLGFTLVLLNCFGGKKFDDLRKDLVKHSYERVSGLLYYLVGLTTPDRGLKQSEVVPEL